MLLSVYLPSLILSFGRGILIPTLPLYADAFGGSYALVGVVLAGEAIGLLIADLPAGALLARLERRTGMALGIGIVALSTLALALSASLWQVFLARVASGLGGALWNISRHAYITEATQSAGRGRAIALFGGTARLGTFAGPAVGGLVAAAYGLRAPFLLVAALAGLTALLAAIFTEPSPAAAEGATERQSTFSLARAHAKILGTAGLGQLLAQMIRSARSVLIPLYGHSTLGLGVEAVGWLMSIASFVDMTMFYPAGLVMDRRGRKHAIVPSFAVQGLAMLLVPFTTSFLGLLVVTSVMGLANGLSSGTMMTLGADLAPRGAIGEFLGLWRLVGDGGTTGGPLIVGAVASALTLPSAALAMGLVGLAAAAVFAYGVPETLRRQRS